jgi:hypothetical protein
MKIQSTGHLPKFEARFRVTKPVVDHLTFVSGNSAGVNGLTGIGISSGASPNGPNGNQGPSAPDFHQLVVDTLRLSEANGSAQLINQHPGGVGFISTIMGGLSAASAIYMQNVVHPTVPEK